jgi:hypothetical protein
MPDRIMFDSNAYDAIAADGAIMALIEHHRERGCIVVLETHVQADELAKIPPHKDIGQSNAVAAQRIPTTGAAWDVSKWDQAQWGSDATNRTITDLTSGNPKHIEDALIGATALDSVDILVTNDGRLRNKLLTSKLRVMSSADFAAYLRSLT